MSPEVRVIVVIFLTLVALIGLLAGGCSILFTPALFQDPSIFVIWVIGMIFGAIGVSAIFGIRKILRRSAAQTPPPPTE
ncbi:hypothetical protein [Pseudoprimorskyibacter insulae]|uniref:Lipopolysaccharide assembly protein A domain-containing protein n=1 Tax=Pseudoprimorskyibacter insulae TaxID=1695997 RepID=A0A2R8AW95_9RHOB|nr:hypothetical protein [Pseudoprimorskyibacter insulae]SPF80139.1 hypothetical protein PRI8871_01943 [Pseudoprimorskyibacter insulae]